MKTTACQYCEKEIRNSGLQTHERICMYGPMGDAVRELILSMSSSGEAPSLDEYQNARTPEMPSVSLISSQYGNWSVFIESMGLQIRSSRPGKNKQAWAQLVKIVDTMHDEYLRTVAEERAHTLKAMHEWRPRTYTQNGRMWQEQYTVLR